MLFRLLFFATLVIKREMRFCDLKFIFANSFHFWICKMLFQGSLKINMFQHHIWSKPFIWYVVIKYEAHCQAIMELNMA